MAAKNTEALWFRSTLTLLWHCSPFKGQSGATDCPLGLELTQRRRGALTLNGAAQRCRAQSARQQLRRVSNSACKKPHDGSKLAASVLGVQLNASELDRRSPAQTRYVTEQSGEPRSQSPQGAHLEAPEPISRRVSVAQTLLVMRSSQFACVGWLPEAWDSVAWIRTAVELLAPVVPPPVLLVTSGCTADPLAHGWPERTGGR